MEWGERATKIAFYEVLSVVDLGRATRTAYYEVLSGVDPGQAPFVIGTSSRALTVWTWPLVLQGGPEVLERLVLQRSKAGCGSKRGSIIYRGHSYLPPVSVRFVAPRAEFWEEHLGRRSMVVILFDRLGTGSNLFSL